MRVRLDQFRLTESRFNDLWSLPSFFAIESGQISLNLQWCSIYLSLFTLSVRGMRCLRPEVISGELAQFKCFIVWITWDKSS